MKKFIFAALAAVLAFSAAPAAQADDHGVKLGIGGFYKAGFGAIISDDDNAGNPQARDRRSHAIKQDVEVWFTGETKLDNGLTVGALVELEGATTGAAASGNGQVDDTMMYIKGSFGEVRVGDTDDARILKSVTGPRASNVFNADHLTGEFLSFSNNPMTGLTSYANNNSGANSTIQYVEPSGTKVIYLSPSFNGFSIGASYTPDANSDRTNQGGLIPQDNNGGDNSEAYSVAASYQGKFGGNVNVGASVGYTGSNNEAAGTDDVDAWQAGLNVGFGQFAVGGSYGLLKNGLGNDRDVNVYGLSGTYNTGPYTVGLGWTHGKYEVTAAREPVLDTYTLSGAYNLGPGITLDAALAFNDYDNDGNTAIGSGLTATDDYQSTSVMVGSTISF
jgi:outer membrane protein OmpU